MYNIIGTIDREETIDRLISDSHMGVPTKTSY